MGISNTIIYAGLACSITVALLRICVNGAILSVIFIWCHVNHKNMNNYANEAKREKLF